MPESKHRRKNKTRPRPRNVEGPVKKPPPSPPWVPVTGTALLILGVVIILLGYLPSIGDMTASWPWIGQNWPLVGGFVLIAAGFGFLTRWR